MKKALTLFVLCILACVLLTGCKKNDTSDLKDKLKAGADSAKEQESTQTDKKKTKKKKNTKDPEEEKADVPVVQAGEAVYYDGKIIFRVYTYSSYDFDGLYGEFSRNYHAYQPSTIYSFDPQAPEKGITKLCDDYGTGTMYLINGEELYSQYVAEGPEDANNWRVYKRHLPDGEPEEICNGRIKGFSPDGERFTVFDYTYDEYTEHYRIYNTGDVDVDSAHYESSSVITYLGMDNEGAYLFEQNDGGTYDVAKLTNDGREYYLASCDFSKLNSQYGSDYPQYDGRISFDGKDMTFQVDFYEGTGHFYYGSVKTTVPVAAEGESFDAPLYDAKMEDVIPEEDYYGAHADPEQQVPEKIGPYAYVYPGYESGKGIANVLQYYEELSDGIFYVMAESHRDPIEDIGWREAYYLQNVMYYFMPSKEDKPVLLHTMFEPLGKRGSLTKYEYYEEQPTIFAYANFLADESGRFRGVLYEPIYVAGPEMPIDLSDVYYVADLSEEFYYEHPHDDDIYEEFDVEGLDAFENMINSWLFENNPPVRTVKTDSNGSVLYDNNMEIEEGGGVYMCHLAFDEDGKVYYIRPVIME